MFGTGQSGLLFGATPIQNSSTGFFSSNTTTSNGTTFPYHPTDSTDTIQKNNINVTLSTKLHCLTAMKTYESKSIEELRWDDYQANRLTKSGGSMFGGNQQMTAHTPMFTSSYSPYTPNQPTQSTLFTNSNQQTNTFGSKSPFAATNSVTTPAFGNFNNQSKPNSLFSNTTSTTNKPIFGNQTTSIFGAPTSTTGSTLFGSQQQSVQPNTSFFGSTQSSNIFTNPTSTQGFQSQSNATLFSGNTSKPFGNTPGFAATSTPSVFGNATSTSGSLFGGQQNNTQSPFGATSKASIFPGTNAFSPQSSTNQPGGLFTQPAVSAIGSTGLFSNTQKPATPGTFGTSLFGTSSAAKPGIFQNVSQNTQFGVQQSNQFGNFSANQPFNPQTVTSTNASTIGYNNPAEALLQQQLTQQKILSLVSNRPYGVNKLFMGQNLLSEKIATSTDTATNNTNITSLAIKRNDTDKFGMVQRRKILSEQTKVYPNILHKVFSGFDADDDISLKSSNTMDKGFFIKRDDWKFLPLNAFENSRKSILSNKSLNENAIINSNNSIIHDVNFSKDVVSSPFSSSQFLRESDTKKHSTPISNGLYGNDFPNDTFSPIRFDNKQSIINAKEEIDDGKFGISSFVQCDYSQNEIKEKDEEVPVQEHENERLCHVKLTKEGYYMAPLIEVMDKLVTKNDDDEYECWVENFIVGRNSCGSIRFPGFTDVYGLDLDQLVDIRHKEVSVYPDDEMKPDIGEGLNKVAQIILQQIFPNDKTSGEPIMDEDRLKAIHFEDKLKKITEKMKAKFISFTAEKGVWVFEVKHFSKYRYSDDEDEDNDKNLIKKDLQSKQNSIKDIKSPMVISAEADSMTNFPEEVEHSFSKPKEGLYRFFDTNKNKSIQKMKKSLNQYDNDEENANHTIFKSIISTKEYKQKDEPSAKRFQTSNMGLTILDSSSNNSIFNKQIVLMESNIEDYSALLDCRPIKHIEAEPLSSTEIIVHDDRSRHSLIIPHRFRDVKSLKMPYLPLSFNRYFGLNLGDIQTKYSIDAGLSHGNRYRVGFHLSSNSESAGLKIFVKDYSNHCDESLTSLGIRHDSVVHNAINLMKFEYTFTEYQEKLLQSALNESECLFNNDDDYPIWKPLNSLKVLNSYVNIHSDKVSQDIFEISVFGRIVLLCKALWGAVGDNNAQGNHKEFERKQSISKWIQNESRNTLMEKIQFILKATSLIDIENCNDVILEALCCGYVKLACQLATLTKQYRMALLISQGAASVQGKYIIREQLNLWNVDKTDQKIPPNVLCIYILLSGQSSATISDGSIITPLKHLKWYQSFGCYQWFIQPYSDSIKSCLDLYTEDFKTDFDIPPPFPFNIYAESSDEDYPYYDCCYHLLKLYCDSFYEIDSILNPPTVSKSNIHKLSTDWSPSWHLSNILSSLGTNNLSCDRLCNEWAAQLERGGQWQWSAFIILHINNVSCRKAMLRNLIIRNVTGCETLNEKEAFVVEKVKVPVKLIYEAKAIYCKNIKDADLEAHHWFMFGDYDKSHSIYVEEILPKLLLNDKLDKMTQILTQFTEIEADVHLPNWIYGGGIYLQYLSIKRAINTLKIVNKLVNHSIVADEFSENIVDGDGEDLTLEVKKLKMKVSKLMNIIGNYKNNSDIKKICKQQIECLCSTFVLSCSNMST